MRKKKAISSFLMFMFSCTMFLQNVNIKANATTNEISMINDMTVNGDSNKFSYFGTGWGSGNTSRSYNGSR